LSLEFASEIYSFLLLPVTKIFVYFVYYTNSMDQIQVCISWNLTLNPCVIGIVVLCAVNEECLLPRNEQTHWSKIKTYK